MKWFLLFKKQQPPDRPDINSSGVTIVELIVTIIVGTMLIITTNEAVNNYTSLGYHSKYLTLANSFVEAQAEELRNQGYNAINVGTTSLTSQLPAGLMPPRSSTLQISNPSAGIKQVDITISYNDQGNKTYSYTTYIGELGVGQ